MKNRLPFYPLLILVLLGCAPSLYQPAEKVVYNKYDVKPGQGDTAMQRMLAPYSAAINQTMNTVIGEMAQPLEKKFPENSLGFFMTDAYLQEAEKIFGTYVDLAFMNTGGIRLNNMPAGKITLGSIYELMPFDNLMVLITLDGKQLQALMNHVAGRGGWSISGGTYTIENKTATNIAINNQPIDANRQYTVALSDYIANGGDDCTMLTSLPQQNKGYLQRDALINYVKSKTATGKKVEMPSMNRIRIIQ